MRVFPDFPPLAAKAGVIVGATLGSVFGFIFLLILCLWCVLRRRRDNEDDMANDIKWVKRILSFWTWISTLNNIELKSEPKL